MTVFAPVATVPDLRAVAAHFAATSDEEDLFASLVRLPFYRAHSAELSRADVDAISKLLHTSWGTEYAMRATLELGDDAFMRGAFHWTLPQAYYAVINGLQAFLYTVGVRGHNSDLLCREAGRLVVRNAYPRAASFYAAGAYGDVSVHRLPLQGYSAGHIDSDEIRTQGEVARLLLRARKQRGQQVRASVQANPNTAIRSQKTGKPLDKWTAEHWQQITWRLGYTTVFDLLHAFKGAEGSTAASWFSLNLDDPRTLHQALVNIVDYLGSVHEAYVAKAMGGAAYAKLVAALPAHLQNGFVQERMERICQAQHAL